MYSHRKVSVRIDDSGKHIYHSGKTYTCVDDKKELQKKKTIRKIVGKTFTSFMNEMMGERSSILGKIFESIRFSMNETGVDIPVKMDNGNKVTDIFITEKELWMPKFDSDHFYRTIYSDMQTKKTPIMASIALYINLRLRMPVFLFVQNRNADLIQLRQRLTEFFTAWHKHVQGKELAECFKSEMIILEPERGKLATQETIRTAMNAGISKVFVSLFSATDINPIVDMVEGNELKRYTIILDEADFLDSGRDDSAVAKAFDRLCKHATFVQNVTATPLTTLAHRVCLRRHFFVMPPPSCYKGLAQVTWKDLPYNAEPCNLTGDDPFVKDPNLIPFLESYHKKFIPSVSIYKEKVPRYLLVRMGRTIEPQLKAATYTHTYYPKTVVITWNGGDQGTTMRSNILPKESINFPGTRIYSDYKDGIHHFNNVHIGKLISYLHANRKTPNDGLRFERIIVFAGVMADRGITFGADNYSDCKESGNSWWHLTDLYYIGSKKRSIQNLSNILQACGRICGVYHDNISLSLYSNWVDGIREGYRLEQELIDRVQTIGNLNENILENLREMKVSKDKKVKKMRMTNESVREPMQWIKGSDVDFGGWTEEKRRELMEGDRVEEDIGQEKINIRDELAEDDFKDICEKFNKWSHGDTKIARFMQSGVEPEKHYTKREFAELCKEHGIEQSHLFRRAYANSKGYGKIFKREKDVVYMYPELVPVFTRHF